MAVAGKEAALATLKQILDDDRPDKPFALQKPPQGSRTESMDNWVWNDEPKTPTMTGLRCAGTYRRLTEVPDPAEAVALSKIIHLPPAEALEAGRCRRTVPFTEVQERYLRASLDVTMKGGIASGVIYPLAICELARSFRLRNIGGASAGAIAAGLAAAAELGRVREAAEAQVPGQPAPFDARRGYPGLAGTVAWLTQLGDPAGGAPVEAREQYRLAQLFQPLRATRPLFRLLVALMRKRYWVLPALLVTSFGPKMMFASLAFLVMLPFLLFGASAWETPSAPPDRILPILLGAGWLASASLLLFGGVTGAVLIKARLAATRGDNRAENDPKDLRRPLDPPQIPTSRSWIGSLIMAAVGAGGLIALWQSSNWQWLGLVRSLGVWLFGLIGMTVLTTISIGWMLSHARNQYFGIVGGATVDEGVRAAAGRPLDWAVGLPPRIDVPNLTDWIEQKLRELSGTSEGEILRFGHLWCQDKYKGPGGRILPDVEAAWHDPRRRVINLELMTTELVFRKPYRFPFPHPGRDAMGKMLKQTEQYYVRRSDLQYLFPQTIVDAICNQKTEVWHEDISVGKVAKRDVVTGDEIEDLFRLPCMPDLPVIFAVRASLSFPGLLKPIRLYRSAEGGRPLRDDFGAKLKRGNDELRFPPGERTRDDEKSPWMQELWFSDGGITSNFPIHFFDRVLPLWPTVGINLGPHPRGYEWQDVFLPTDAQTPYGVAANIKKSFVSFLGAVGSTSMTWRDSVQTFLPASRGRVVWVRQRNYEGGANLFMTREQVATLALRGAVAGARLRRRFAEDAHWQRHQWLRMRTALNNLADLKATIDESTRQALYVELMSGKAAGTAATMRIFDALRNAGDPTPSGPENPFENPHVPEGNTDALDWFQPEKPWTFWGAAKRLGDFYRRTTPPAERFEDAHLPQPAASIRQVPPA